MTVSGYMTTKQVCRRYNITSRTLSRWQDETAHHNPFPRPTKAAFGSTNRWSKEVVMAWEEAGMLGQRIKGGQVAA